MLLEACAVASSWSLKLLTICVELGVVSASFQIYCWKILEEAITLPTPKQPQNHLFLEKETGKRNIYALV